MLGRSINLIFSIQVACPYSNCGYKVDPVPYSEIGKVYSVKNIFNSIPKRNIFLTNITLDLKDLVNNKILYKGVPRQSQRCYVSQAALWVAAAQQLVGQDRAGIRASRPNGKQDLNINNVYNLQHMKPLPRSLATTWYLTPPAL